MQKIYNCVIFAKNGTFVFRFEFECPNAFFCLLKSIYVSLFYLCLSLGLADYLSLFLKISLILCYLISNIETVWVLLIEWISRRFCKYAFAMERRPTWNICNISNRVLPSTTLFSKTDTDVSNNQCQVLSRLW